MLTLPVPANRSSTRNPEKSRGKMLKSDSLTLPAVGRTRSTLGHNQATAFRRSTNDSHGI